ncbi:MAG: calcineurin-like phosphoesterase C-terminal domain-containing protein [Alistipes sp.]|nr:calcineurin-like phosphoesterase C-terminal domain-containing protein [Alistipes sp.]
MKKSILFLTILSLLFIACSPTPDDGTGNNEQPIVPSGAINSVTVTIDNSTRVSAVVDNNDNLSAYWSGGDQIIVTDRNSFATFTLDSGEGSNRGAFTGSLEVAEGALYALYPASSFNPAQSRNSLSVTIPTEQSHSNGIGKDIKDKVILFGGGDAKHNFTLTPAIAAVRFNLTVAPTESIQSITMKAEQCKISGAASLNPQTAALTATGCDSVVLNFASAPKGKTAEGWVAIAPTAFSKSSARVLYNITTTDAQYSFCYTPDRDLAAGEVYTATLDINTFVQVESRESLSQGEFYSSKGIPEVIPEPGTVARGTVTYDDGTPATGVSISDGFSVVQTDQNGRYSLTPHTDAWYIYYSLPADCQTVTNSYGQPEFFIKYEPERYIYNFTLTKLAGGKESRFALFCLADPQCSNSTGRSRFQKESVPHIKALAESKGVPCYGVTLGDIVSSGDSSDTTPQMPYMRDHMSKSKTGIAIYQTMGNHDYLYFNSSAPIEADETSSTYNIKAQRLFEDIFGPVNHSWNRSDTHIVCMRDMLWNSNSSGGDYSLGFSDEQYEWLRQDLSYVPKDKLVILCVHIPLVNSTKKNVQNVIALLASYNEAHIMAGHTHYMRNEPTLSSGVYEHVHAAVCGAWWHSNTNGDGCPNGYGVYDIEGNTITNWYYQGVNTGQNDRDYQMRLYRGDHKSGGQYEYFAQQHGDGVILANVFNADPSWSVKVYENGVYSGDMTMIKNKKETPTKGTGIDNPTKPSTASSQDWWAIGYHVGVKKRSRTSYNTNGFHLYKYTLKDKNASVRVEATDRFGRTYSCSTITADYDYSLMK